MAGGVSFLPAPMECEAIGKLLIISRTVNAVIKNVLPYKEKLSFPSDLDFIFNPPRPSLSFRMRISH